MKFFLSTLLLLFLSLNFSIAQSQTFEGTEVLFKKTSPINNTFKSAKVFNLDATELKNYLESDDFDEEVHLSFADQHDWEMELYPTELRSANYKLLTATEQGIVELPRSDVKTFYGYLKGKPGSEIKLTVGENFVYGFVRTGRHEYYIEPAGRFQTHLNDNDFIIYDSHDVKGNEATCAVNETHERQENLGKNSTGNSAKPVVGNCYELELAIAADYSYFVDRGASIAAVEAYTIGVMNNVQTNYEYSGSVNFDDGVEFSIVEQFVSTCSTCDPWSNSTDVDILLPSFRNWAPSGFTAPHDLGQFWTNRDFDGSTIGYAYVGVVCSSARYHILQDYTTTAWQLRVLTSHEMGHNFGANHDSANGDIMAPSVGANTNSWSALSKSVVSPNILAYNCLELCGSNPPLTNFLSNVTSGCTGTVVQFEDATAGNPTSWNWTFPGGTPSSSTVENPTVTYNSEGTFDVSLVTTNAAGTGTTETKSNLISIEFNAPTRDCFPSITNASNQGANYFVGVTNVTLGNINNTTPRSSTEGVAYVDYACSNTTTLDAGNNYSIAITAGRPGFLENAKAWIDFNGDGDFQDNGEEIFSETDMDGTSRAQVFSTPGFPLEGQLLVMRVVSDVYYRTVVDCPTASSLGQAEDYGIFFNVSLGLPVELVSFAGKQVDETIQLNWKTASETNNDYFTLEHSTDATNFEYLATVNGKGTEVSSTSYRELHTRPISGTNYYRLSQTDFDGTTEVFEVIAVNFKTGKTEAVIQPNPVREGLLNLKYISAEDDDDLEIEVVDISGRVLLQRKIAIVEGLNYLEFPIEDWSNGVYYLRAIQGREIKSIKFVKVE